MALPDDHRTIEVESFEDKDRAAHRGKVCVRPVKDQQFPTNLLVEGNRSLVKDYPVGTRFKVQASLMKRPDGEAYLFSSWQWDAQVLSQPEPES
jgi:hypothetical protein